MRGESCRVAVENVNFGCNSSPVSFSAPIVQPRPVKTVNTVSAFIKHPEHCATTAVLPKWGGCADQQGSAALLSPVIALVVPFKSSSPCYSQGCF